MNALLNIASLEVGYEKKVILQNIQLSINNPAFISLVGRNGEGKSTLLKTIAGLIPSLNGSITFFEKKLTHLSAKEKATFFSIVLAHPPQIGTISVRDFVGYGRYPYTNWLAVKTKKDDLLIDEALQLCGLTKFAQRNFANLSDGEKQKVAIARAIAQNTPVIILDEPTSHLDMVNQIEIFDLLKKLVIEQQKTIIMSSHQLQLALNYADQIWLLKSGAVETNTPQFYIQNKTFEKLFKIDSFKT